MSEPESGRVVRQLRHDVDDVYELLATVQQSVAGLAETANARLDRIDAIQTQQAGRLDRIEATQTQQAGRLDAIDGRLDQILELLRRQP